MKKAILMPVAVLITAFFAQNVSAEMYKWTDKDGKTQYTQTPPPADVKSQDIEDDIRLSTGKLGNTIPVAPDKGKAKDPMEQAQEDGAKSEQKHRDFCAQQADALKQMTANSLIKWKDQQGERYLTADEKSTKMKELQKNIDAMCRPEMFSPQDKGDGKTSRTEKAADARYATDNSAIKQGGGSASTPTGKDNNSAASGSGTGNAPAAASQLPAAN